MLLGKEQEMLLKIILFYLKITLNLLKNETFKKLSMKSTRLEAGWNENYLLKILNLKV